MLKLNLACGGVVVDGWVSVDYSLGARFQKIPVVRRLPLFRFEWSDKIIIHDLKKPFPWKNADVIYSSHFLEHLDREQGRVFLQRCRQTLSPGGIIRIVVPDFRLVVTEYQAGRLKSSQFLEKCNAVYSDRRFARLLEFPHKCMYDTDSLLEAMSLAGFSCRPRQPFDSDIDDIRLIEKESRAANAVILEGN